MPLVSSTRSVYDYEKIKNEACKPVKERDKIIQTKKGKQIPRRYHLLDDKLNEMLLQKQNGNFPNPFRKNGVYYSFLQALINLGVNQKHSFVEVKKEMKNIMQGIKDKKGRDLWDVFCNKKSSKLISNWDVNTRINHTGRILQRISSYHPYGYKLKQLNSGIQIYVGQHKLPLYELRTDFHDENSVVVFNEFKKKK